MINKDRTSFSPRTSLETVIPLDTPYVLMIDPASSCNLRCTFCPTGYTNLIKNSKRFQGYMQLDMYKSIIDQVNDFKSPLKTLRLYKEGEPLVNPNFVDFIKIAKKNKKILRVDTTTNGILLNHRLSEKIIESGIDQINISVNGVSSEQYYRLTKVKLDFKKFVDEIKFLHSISGDSTIYVKGIAENFNELEKNKFYEIFTDISDRIFLEHLQPNWPKFEVPFLANKEYTVGLYGAELKDRDVCPYIFYIMVINSDGSVSACVQDWQHKLILGNITDHKLVDIWNRGLHKDLQLLHLSKKRCSQEICSICPVLKHGALDNIDKYSEIIYKKIESL